MSITRTRKVIAILLACMMVFGMTGTAALAAGNGTGTGTGKGSGKGKYVSEVFIAYGKDEAAAKRWLTDNGWEPIIGDCDFNAGKASFFDNNKIQDQNVAAVMGIRRTDQSSEAITDMAVMNMKGGYSIPDYEALLEEKKADIREFANSFLTVIREDRANAGGSGSAFGKQRADLARSLLNKFYDGGKGEPYAANDTGVKLGDLFLEETLQEGNEKGADLEQILLEASGPAVLAVETLLATGADTGKTSWLARANSLTGDELSKNLEKYVPEAAGQDVAASAAQQFLNQHYGDTAAALSEEWITIHDEMVWYEQYNEEHDLWPHEGEDGNAYSDRLTQYFEALAADSPQADSEAELYASSAILYNNLYSLPYR